MKKKRIFALLLCVAMLVSLVPNAFAADTTYTDSTSAIYENGDLIMNKSATFDVASETGTITLEAYTKGEIKTTPTDVVLVIDHSGSMWTAVDPDKQLKLSELSTTKGKREGYYVAYDTKTGNTAHLLKYESGKWKMSKAFGSTHYEDGQFVGFNNTVVGTANRVYSEITEPNRYIYCMTISGALYDALDIFMDEMKNAINCRVAVVTFAGTVRDTPADKSPSGEIVPARDKNSNNDLIEGVDYVGSGIFIDGKLTWDSTVNNKQIKNEDYRKAFEDPTTANGQNILQATVNAINTDYGNTPTALGLLYARRLFLQSGRSNANNIAIVFTDGIPAPASLQPRTSDSCTHNYDDYKAKYGSELTQNTNAAGVILSEYLGKINDGENQDGGFCPYCNLVRSSDTADNKATYITCSTYIDQAYKLKKDQKATVYSIGPTAGKAGVEVLSNIATSSNHYKQAGGAEITQAFKEIAGVIVQSSIALNKSAVMVDGLANCFELPENATTSDIKVYTAPYTGVDGNGKDSFGTPVAFADAQIEVDAAANTVSVSNFDYNTNNVYTAPDGAHGNKLIVEIPFKVADDFLGGNKIETNTANSGIRGPGSSAVTYEFESPVVEEVPVRTIIPVTNPGKIYVSQEAEIPHIINIGQFREDKGSLVTVDGKNNAFAKIVYTITDKSNPDNSMVYTIPRGATMANLDFMNPKDPNWQINGSGISVKQVLENDANYAISCEVISVDDATGTNKSKGNVETSILVYKPEVTFEDSFIRWGDTANYADNYVSVVWKHGETPADATMGTAPTLSYTYDVAADEFHADTPVKVTSVISPKNGALKHDVPAEMNIIDYTTFHREACDFSTCGHKGSSGLGALDPNFIVHLLRFDLVIGKTGILDVDNHAADNNSNAEIQSTVFTVTNVGTGFSMDVTINGNDTAKILDLPAATTPYTVTEKTDWSWRYDPAGGETKTVEQVTTDGVTRTVNFKNDRNVTKWLNGAFRIENVFDGIGQ